MAYLKDGKMVAYLVAKMVEWDLPKALHLAESMAAR
jgi:hypothetical protein